MADVDPEFECGDEAINTPTAPLEDVLKANGEEPLYGRIMELSANTGDTSLVIFAWQNMEAFMKAFHVAQAQAAAPGGKPLPECPLCLPAVVAEQNFKEAVLDYVRILGAPARLGTSCLPCSLSQSTQLAFVLRDLDSNPWMQQIMAVGVMANALPIACIYVAPPGSNILERATPQLPFSLWA